MVGRVDQMVQVAYRREAYSVVRLWLSQYRAVHVQDDYTLSAAPGNIGGGLVMFERAQVQVVSHDEVFAYGCSICSE